MTPSQHLGRLFERSAIHTMQSTGSRSNTPDLEEDTLLQPLDFSATGLTDEMPAAKKLGDDRGTIDTVGLGLVYVRRTPFYHSELTFLGRLWSTCSAYIHTGASRELCCKSSTSTKMVLISRNTDGSHFILYCRVCL